MPEFVMEGRDHAARDEDEFTLGYIEAMFFTADDELRVYGYDDLAPDALAAIRADCAKWQAGNSDALDRAYGDDYDATQAGSDYWFSRNGHGVGFWDRGLGDVGDELDRAASAAGQIDAYLGDDGKVHI